MRIVIAALAIAGLAVSADAAPETKKKQRYSASEERPQQGRTARHSARSQFGYDASPEHWRVGSSEWWQAMDRQGRGGFGETP